MVGGSRNIRDSREDDRICGDYYITRVLGRGSYGMVSLVLGPNGQAHAAKKSLATITLPTSGDKIPFIDFYTEVDLLLRFDHPNLMTADAYFYSPKETCAILPVASSDLAKWIETGAPLKDRLKVLQGCCRGLAYLHANGVIHQDIKPANILMEGSTPKISDFGASATTLGRKLPYTHEIVTSWWRPPELFYESTGTYEYSYEVDVWSMLVVASELVFGLIPVGRYYLDHNGNPLEGEAVAKKIAETGGYVPPRYNVSLTPRESVEARIARKGDADASSRHSSFAKWLSDAMAASPKNRPDASKFYARVAKETGTRAVAKERIAFHPAEVAYRNSFNEESRAMGVKFIREEVEGRTFLLAIDIFDRASTVVNDTLDDIDQNAGVAVFLALVISGEVTVLREMAHFDVGGFASHLEKVLKALKFHIYRPDMVSTAGLSPGTAIKLAMENLSPSTVEKTVSSAPKTKRRGSPGVRAAPSSDKEPEERDLSPRRPVGNRGWWSRMTATPTETPVLMF